MKKNQSKEKIGLHPVMVLLLLCFITIIISGVLSFFNVQATYNRVSSKNGYKNNYRIKGDFSGKC